MDMIMIKSEHHFVEAFREVCKRIICSSLGESAGEALLFLLQDALKCDPFSVLWNDPKSFYRSLEGVLGAGSRVLINILVAGLNREYNLDVDSEHLVKLMLSGDRGSAEEIRFFIRKVVTSCEELEVT